MLQVSLPFIPEILVKSCIFWKPSETEHLGLLSGELFGGEVSKHRASDRAELEPGPGEPDPDDDVCPGHCIDDGVLVRGHGVHAGLLHGHAGLHAREFLSNKLLKEFLQIPSVSFVA